MEEPSQEQLKDQIDELIRTIPDLSQIKLRDIRVSLEEHFKCSLISRKQLIREILQTTIQENADQLSAQLHIEQKRKVRPRSKLANDDAFEYDDDAWNEDIESPEDEGSDYSETKRMRRDKRKDRKKKKRARRSRGESLQDEKDEDWTPHRRPATRHRGTARSGFMAPQTLSDELAAICKAEQLPRPHVVRAVWAYVKEHQLQDPSDRKYILCDEALRKVFGEARISGFGMNKVISQHLSKVGAPPAEHPAAAETTGAEAEAKAHAEAEECMDVVHPTEAEAATVTTTPAAAPDATETKAEAEAERGRGEARSRLVGTRNRTDCACGGEPDRPYQEYH
eukprot:gnl/Trimastix_PCT/1409.p2 GENE.gnl/Trimastix_PCT/1409~~gnl/Trimastix_PCT/1409.p2  ORF type:complete len:353 (+),score=90.64 gnl/Trimastix_PCT/1409:46-1059(+)